MIGSPRAITARLRQLRDHLAQQHRVEAGLHVEGNATDADRDRARSVRNADQPGEPGRCPGGAEQGWAGYTLQLADVNGDGCADLVWNSLGTINRTYVSLSQL